MISSVETRTTNKQSNALVTGIASEQDPLASQAGHWYQRETGVAVYEVPMTSKEGMRRTSLKDARKLDLVPSVTTINKAMAAPGLEIWKAEQLLQSALTLPKQQGETLDAYAKRVVEDSKQQGITAANRGKQLHAAIEDYIRGHIAPEWKEHLILLDKTLEQHGIDIHAGQPEHSFAAQVGGLWYGGKIDYYRNQKDHFLGDSIILDFKSKDKIEPKKQLVYEEHAMQIAAYGYGLFGRITSSKPWDWEAFRGLNVFVGVQDCEIRVHEHTPEDLEHAFELFRSILDFWTRKNKFGKYAKEKK